MRNEEYSEVGFHEADVRSFVYSDGRVVLVLDGVDWSKGKVSVEITVLDVTAVETDGLRCEGDMMEQAVGEVLVLKLIDNGFYSLIDWRAFQPLRTKTAEYSVEGRQLLIVEVDALQV